MFTEADLNQFSGTETYWKHWMGIVYTDGVQFLSQNGAGWLVDLVASHQLNPKLRTGDLNDFQLWELTVNDDNTAVATCRGDSDTPVVVEQKIEFSDFPLKNIKLYLERGSIDGTNSVKILMLPSER